jgi:hypothetical protein
MPKANSLRALSVSTLEQTDRFCDLQLRIVAQNERGENLPNEKFLQVGGRWDKLAKRYVGDASRSMIVGLHPGQFEAARWLVRWFEDKVRVGKVTPTETAFATLLIYSVLLHGGRRAGKTDMAAKFGVAYAIMRPNSWVWMVSESIPKTEELLEAVKAFMPSAWYSELGAPHYKMTLANGSVIWFRSAHKPSKLKRGRCDFAVLNEAQNMAEEAFAIVRAATADNGGLTIPTANPPDQPIGFWVEDFFESARARRRQAREFHLDADKNPHVDRRSLEAMKDEVDDRTYRREIRGEFMPRADVVFYAWSNGAGGNVRPMPQVGAVEVTRTFTKAKLYREFDRVLGVDLQKIPYPCAVSLRMFEDPEDPKGDPLIWLDDEIIVEEGNEEALSARMLEHGYDPDRTALIIDASGSWQGIDRKRQTPSFEIFESLGWRWIFKPDEEMEKNPDILERVRVGNTRMKTSSGKRRLFSVPELIQTNKALKSWETRHGIAYRRSIYAHIGDAVTYPLYRFFPRHDLAIGSAKETAKGVVFVPRQPLKPRLL